MMYVIDGFEWDEENKHTKEYWKPICELTFLENDLIYILFETVHWHKGISADWINSMRPGYARHMPEGEMI